MTRYNYKGFYGDYGYMIVHNDGTTTLEMVIPGYPTGRLYRKKYKTFTGAKIALGKMSDSYTLTECRKEGATR